MTIWIRRAMLLTVMSLGPVACGGGGGGGSDPPPPPPPPPSFTYSAELTALDMTDMRNDTAVVSTGLPVTGAVATRR